MWGESSAWTMAFICFLWLSSAALCDWSEEVDILIAPCTAQRICVSVFIFSFVGSGPPAPLLSCCGKKILLGVDYDVPFFLP